VSPAARWRLAFLGLTAVVLGMEVWAGFDSDAAQTDAWTDMIVRWVPGEVTALVLGGLTVWLAAHFGIRYWNKAKENKLMQTPSLGRIVLVPADPNSNNGANEAPAVVTRVWAEKSDGWLVNLRVLLDGSGVPEWRTSVTLCETKDAALAVGGTHIGATGIAWWPPRV
jgi:hypothetical protein